MSATYPPTPVSTELRMSDPNQVQKLSLGRNGETQRQVQFDSRDFRYTSTIGSKLIAHFRWPALFRTLLTRW